MPGAGEGEEPGPCVVRRQRDVRGRVVRCRGNTRFIAHRESGVDRLPVERFCGLVEDVFGVVFGDVCAVRLLERS